MRCAGLVVDVGHAMLVQRQLQAGVDAAAASRAWQLFLTSAWRRPSPCSTARRPVSKNAVSTVNNATTVAKVVLSRRAFRAATGATAA